VIRLAACLLAILALGACRLERPPARKAINSYLADARDLATVRRIMVLPFTEEAGVRADRERVRDAFVTELQKLRRFEIVPLPQGAREVAELNETLRHGRLETDAIVSLCERYHLDGVLLGTVTAFRPYKPPHLGLRTQLVSVHSGATVWAVDAIFDCADKTTISDLQHYHDYVRVADASLHGWELTTLAPNHFCGYVAHRFVGTWVED
jgi:hypothetical protein